MAKRQRFSGETIRRLAASLRVTESLRRGGAPPPVPRVAGTNRIVLARANEAVAGGATGSFSIYHGTEKGSETDSDVDVDAYNRGPAVAEDDWCYLSDVNGGWETLLDSSLFGDVVKEVAPCDPFDCIYPGFSLDPFDVCPCGALIYLLHTPTIICGTAQLPEQPQVFFDSGASSDDEGIWFSPEIESDERTFFWKLTVTDTTATIELWETTSGAEVLATWVCDDWCCYCRRRFVAQCPTTFPVACENFPAAICASPFLETVCPTCDEAMADYEYEINAGDTLAGGIDAELCGCTDCCESFRGTHRVHYSSVSAAFDAAGGVYEDCPSWMDGDSNLQTGTPQSCTWVSRFITLLDGTNYLGLWTIVKSGGVWVARAYLLPIPIQCSGTPVYTSLGWGTEGLNPNGYTEDDFACKPGVYRSPSGTCVNPCVPVLVAQYVRDDCDPIGEYTKDEATGYTGLPEEVRLFCETTPDTITVSAVEADQGDCGGGGGGGGSCPDNPDPCGGTCTWTVMNPPVAGQVWTQSVNGCDTDRGGVNLCSCYFPSVGGEGDGDAIRCCNGNTYDARELPNGTEVNCTGCIHNE